MPAVADASDHLAGADLLPPREDDTGRREVGVQRVRSSGCRAQRGQRIGSVSFHWAWMVTMSGVALVRAAMMSAMTWQQHAALPLEARHG
jgi:hypothetical protein